VVTVPDSSNREKRIRALASLAKLFPLPEASKVLAALPGKAAFSPDTRVALAEVLAQSAPDHEFDQFATLARDPELNHITLAVLEAPAKADAGLEKAFHSLPFRTQVKMASTLAVNRAGAHKLIKFAAPRVLADPLVTGKLKALGDSGLADELAKVTSSLPPQNAAINALIASRMKSFDPSKADAAKGETIFMTTCSVCHRIGVKGNLVGPQLDGVGARGVERLLEDVLDPNREVDPAFRLHFVKFKNGDLFTGLLRREDGGTVVFADPAGQEHNVAKADVADDKISEFSLMPAGFGEVLTEAQLHDLLKFLLDRK
jgi:putative heme-binding domain-containing protein